MKTNKLNPESSKAVVDLCDGIVAIFEDKIKSAPFDKSMTAQVIAALPDNKYSVKVPGKTLVVKGYASAQFNAGDFVTLTFPQNNESEARIVPKTGTFRDPYDVSYLHEHGNKLTLDRITDKNVTDMNALKAMAFKDTVTKTDLSAPLAAEIDAKASQADLLNKVDKEAGKGLSANDFTNDYKTKVDNMQPSARQLQTNWAEQNPASVQFLMNKPNVPSASTDLNDSENLVRKNKTYILNCGNSSGCL